MNLLPDLIGAILLSIFAILSIATWDLWRSARARRVTEAASLTKRQHEAMVATVSNIVREAILLGRKK